MKVIYARLNNQRREEFQLITTIRKSEGRLFAFKEAASTKGQPFLNSLIKKYNYLEESNFPFRPVKLQKIGEAIKFDYLDFDSLDNALFAALQRKDIEGIKKVFSSYKVLIDKITSTKQNIDIRFLELFGPDTQKEKIECLQVGCLDVILENILVDGSTNYLIDYEWTFDFPLPKKFIFFRTILNTYFKYWAYDISGMIPADEIFGEFQISKKEEELFHKWEINFQKFVNKNIPDDYILYNKKILREPYPLEKLFQKFGREKEREVQGREKDTKKLKGIIEERDREIKAMKFSKFWKLRGYYVVLRSVPQKFKVLVRKIKKTLEERGFSKTIIHSIRFIIKNRKNIGVIFLLPGWENEAYLNWIEENEDFNENEISEDIERLKYKPKFSVIVPTYNVPKKFLDECLQSVVEQYYDNWELCVYDDASTNRDTLEALEAWKKKNDKRINIVFGRKNQHISGASNEALKKASGDFITLLDHDDTISKDALYENAKILNKHPYADFIYSDEDKLNTKGERSGPFFKPDWSLDMFLGAMYTCHLGSYRKSIVDEIGGFRKGYEGGQDYDLVLRFIEKTKDDRIFHIPKILYHWRMIETSTAYSSATKKYAYEAARKAIEDYLKRNKIKGKVEHGSSLGFFRVKREVSINSLVSIIIPFKDMPNILEKCLDSILSKTEYKNYEIILVNNQSKEKKTEKYLESLKGEKQIRVLDYNKPFNFSAINNFAVKEAKGDYILFLNNDTEVINRDWLSNMLQHAQRKEVGIVGSLLLYPNDTIQHAGIVMGMGGTAGHIFHGVSVKDDSYVDLMKIIRNYSAVTGACLMIRKNIFLEIGGFDEKNFPTAFNDVDLCLKVREKGFLVVFTPYSKLYHYESLSRGYDEEMKRKNPKRYDKFLEEQKNLKIKWQKYIEYDPYYNINLPR